MRILRKLTKSFILLFLVFLAGCEKELDTPPLNQLDPNHKLAIDELRQLYQGQEISFNNGEHFFGIITTDERSGNFYRSHYIQDETGAINIRVDTGIDILEGDSVRVSLNGAKLSAYNNMLQVDGLVYGQNVVRQSRGHSKEPQLVTVSQILQGGMQGQLIKLENVQFVPGALNQTYADAVNQTSQNRDLTDCDGNRIIVRTSGFANFAGTTVEQGNGSFVGIVSVFGTTWQLLIRNLDELDMEGERCSPEGTPMGSGTFEDPYNIPHAIAFNNGTNVWVEGYLVGVMETDVDPFAPNFDGPNWRTNSNIIIAEKADETNIDKCVIVQLLVGDIRNALNLVNNPNNKGKEVKLLGNLTSYISNPGLKETYGYWMDGAGVKPFFAETFASGIGDFVAHNILGAQVWTHATHDGGSMSINGFSGGASHNNEDWLISPQISLAGKENTKLWIREAINFLKNINDLQVLVATDYTEGDPTDYGTWTPLTLTGRPPGSNWTYVDIDMIDLSAYDEQSIHIAFKYTSSPNPGATAWQVSRVVLTAD